MANEPVNQALVAQPGHGVGSVGDLVDHRGELSARTERAPDTLDHDVVAPRRIDGAEEAREGETAAVGTADEQRARRCVGLGCVVVGDEVNAVSHRDG